MDFSTFKSQFSDLADVLPDNFRSRVQKDEFESNILRICIERDRERYLEILEGLVLSTPAKEIVEGSYKNNLHPPREFRGFATEMWGYLAVEKWICDCTVADTPTAGGLPDFTCANADIDIEVSYVGQDDSPYRVRRALEDRFEGTGYFAKTVLLSEFNKIADNYEESEENRGFVETHIDKLESVTPADPPREIETEGLRTEFIEIDAPKFAWATAWEEAEEILLDPNGQFEHVVKRKAEKQRGDIPLVLFFDCDVSFLEIEEIRDLLIGETHTYYNQSDVIISKHIRDCEAVWSDYLIEIGAYPESDYPGAPCIKPGDEGIFYDDELNYVAGLLVRVEDDSCVYIPNVYTDKIDAKSVFDRISKNITREGSTLSRSELSD